MAKNAQILKKLEWLKESERFEHSYKCTFFVKLGIFGTMFFFVCKLAAL